MSNEDYELDWTDFGNVAEDGLIEADDVTTIQNNVDLIKDNLANVTHDNGVLSTHNTTYNDDDKTGVDNSDEIGVLSTHQSDYDSNRLVNNNWSRDTSALGTHLSDYDSSKKGTVKRSKFVGHEDSFFNKDRTDKNTGHQNNDDVTYEGSYYTDVLATYNHDERSEYYYEGICSSFYSSVRNVIVAEPGCASYCIKVMRL